MVIRIFLSILLFGQFSFANSKQDRLVKVANDVANMLENGVELLDESYVDDLSRQLRQIKFELSEEGLVVVNPTPMDPDKFICGPSNEIINATTGDVVADYSSSTACKAAMKDIPTGYICGPNNEIIDVAKIAQVADYSSHTACKAAMKDVPTGYICGPGNELINVASGAVIADYSSSTACKAALGDLVGQ